MGVTYRKNPVSLALINPGKPPKAKAAKKSKAKAKPSKATRTTGGKTVPAKAKKAKKAKAKAPKRSAAKRKAPKRKAMKTALPASVKKAVNTASTAATKASKAADKAEKAAKKASGSVEKVAAKAAAKAVKASKPKARKKPVKKAAPKKRKTAAKKKTTKRKNSKGRTPAQQAATRKMIAANKARAKKSGTKPKAKAKAKTRKSPAKKKTTKRSPAQRAATKKMIAANRAKWNKKLGKKAAKPRKAPSKGSKPRYDKSRKWKEGKRRPGYYPIVGYDVKAHKMQQPHWRYYKNPGVKVMPNGTILDPVSKKFVSPRSARGRQLMKGGGGGGWMNNPVVSTVEQTARHAGSVAIGFFGARAMANIASMSPMVPMSVAPYAPFVAQVTAGFLVYAVGQRVKKFAPYQTSALAGVGLSVIEALVNRFAPDMVQEYTQVPEPGLGDDLLTYRRALSAYEGLNEGWNDYYPGDEAILDSMGEYVLPEDLDPAFDVDPMGEYVLSEDLDPSFDVAGGMGEYVLSEDIDPALEAIGSYNAAQQAALYQVGMGDVFSSRARNQIGMGEYVAVDDLDPAYDFSGGMGEAPKVIGGVYGEAQAGGMFGTQRTNAANRAVAVASAAIESAKATGATPGAAAKAALQAVVSELRIPRYKARRIVLKAMRTVFRGGRGPSMQYVAPAPSVPEILPPEQDDSEFRTGMFAEGMFDPSDDD